MNQQFHFCSFPVSTSSAAEVPAVDDDPDVSSIATVASVLVVADVTSVVGVPAVVHVSLPVRRHHSW